MNCLITQTCAIRRIDLTTGQVETLPGSQGFQTARWSPDGKYIAALQPVRHQLYLYDVRTEKWRKLADGITGNDVSWSSDSQSIYASCLGNDTRIVRVSVATGKTETAVDLRARDPLGRSETTDAWFAVTPDGSLVVINWQQAAEIYSYQVVSH